MVMARLRTKLARGEEEKMAFDAVDVRGVIQQLTQEYKGADHKRFF
jgi:hypothetical protein